MIKDAESSDWDTLPEKTEQGDSSTAIFLFYHPTSVWERGR